MARYYNKELARSIAPAGSSGKYMISRQLRKMEKAGYRVPRPGSRPVHLHEPPWRYRATMAIT